MKPLSVKRQKELERITDFVRGFYRNSDIEQINNTVRAGDSGPYDILGSHLMLNCNLANSVDHLYFFLKNQKKHPEVLRNVDDLIGLNTKFRVVFLTLLIELHITLGCVDSLSVDCSSAILMNEVIEEHDRSKAPAQTIALFQKLIVAINDNSPTAKLIELFLAAANSYDKDLRGLDLYDWCLGRADPIEYHWSTAFHSLHQASVENTKKTLLDQQRRMLESLNTGSTPH